MATVCASFRVEPHSILKNVVVEVASTGFRVRGILTYLRIIYRKGKGARLGDGAVSPYDHKMLFLVFTASQTNCNKQHAEKFMK